MHRHQKGPVEPTPETIQRLYTVMVNDYERKWMIGDLIGLSDEEGFIVMPSARAREIAVHAIFSLIKQHEISFVSDSAFMAIRSE